MDCSTYTGGHSVGSSSPALPRAWKKKGKRLLQHLRMSSSSRKPMLVLYLVCCAAVTTILSFRGSITVRGSRSGESVSDYRYHYRLPVEDVNAITYLSSCARGTFGVCLEEEDRIAAAVESPFASFGVLEKKYFYETYDNRDDLFRVPFLEESYIVDLFPYCDYRPSYARPHNISRFKGVMEVEMVYIFPCDCSLQEKILTSDTITGNRCLGKKEADILTSFFMSRLETKHPKTFKLLRVVNIEVRFDYLKGQRVLLELLLQRGSDPKAYRLSHYYFVTWDNDLMCDLSTHQWNRNAHVHFLLITKDLGFWVKHFLRNMEEVQEVTGDENFSVIVVDFNSTDLDVSRAVRESKLKHKHTIKVFNTTFHKTLAQNKGFDSVKDPNSIVFTVDLHLDIPPNIIETIRKHTLQGKSGYAPAVLRLKNGSYPRTAIRSSSSSSGNSWQGLGRWEMWGYGLFSLYKSDWTAIGNMNLNFGQKWGGEDSDLVDRLLRVGYEVNRLLHMKLFHYYHTHKGMWAKDSNYLSDGIVTEDSNDDAPPVVASSPDSDTEKLTPSQTDSKIFTTGLKPEPSEATDGYR